MVGGDAYSFQAWHLPSGTHARWTVRLHGDRDDALRVLECRATAYAQLAAALAGETVTDRDDALPNKPPASSASNMAPA
jgi:hypothetical protein